MNEKGTEFLNKLYRKLHMSPEVIGASKNNLRLTPIEKIQTYLTKLEDVHTKYIDNEKAMQKLKKMYYDKYVIKENNVPESYFELQKRIALEEGRGYIELDSKERQQMIENIIYEQKKSLDCWIDYFICSNSDIYPMWLKYWAFQGMLSLGKFDIKTSSFNKRTSTTIAPFVNLNREALAITMDFLIKSNNGYDINDETLNVLLKRGSFGKIYLYLLRKLDNQRKTTINSNAGEWKRYIKDSDYLPLVKSLEGYGTNWCTAGELVAKVQLAAGDFYVYYSYDNEGNPTIPRIAIRMERKKIVEIRGIAANQNIESDMETILEKKLEEFPDKDEYKKKVSNMKYLTLIYNKNCMGGGLSKEELRFLYEIDGKVMGFGYGKDPRIKKILSQRDKEADLCLIFNCNKNQLSFSKDNAPSGNIIYHGGNLDFGGLTTTTGLVLPKTIDGNLDLSSLSTTTGLVLPETIGGDLDLSGLTTATGIVLPQTIGGNLYLGALKTATGLVLPKTIGGSLYLSGLKTATDLVLPETIGGNLDLNGLATAVGLVLPQIGGYLDLSGLRTTENLILSKTIMGDIDFSGLTTAVHLVLPQTIGGSLYLNSLTTTIGLDLPKTIGDNLYLGSLTTVEDLILPQTIGGDLDLSGLTTTTGLVLPETIDGSLYLNSLTTATDLALSKTIGGNIYLGTLTTAEGLVLPQTIGGSLYLWSLQMAACLVLPQTIEGDLDLSSLKTLTGLVLSPEFNVLGSIIFNNKVLTTDEFIHECNSSFIDNHDNNKILYMKKNN